MSISDEEKVLGIDLGTTYSCVAVWRNGKVEVITNEHGIRTTPSVVSFTNKDILIGNVAKNQMRRNYKNTVYDAKRLIGRLYNDKEVQEDMKLWPFKVKDDGKNRPLIEVEYLNEKKGFYPEEISSIILKYLKKISESYEGKEVKNAIITVPAYFNSSQRKATKLAGESAGLNVLRIINEPTAAAIAYGLNEYRNEHKRNVCVIDFGGGTLDVSILSIFDGVFEVLATGGDSHLGGEDIDNRLLNYCINEFKKQSFIDINNNKKAKCRLKVECENAKLQLSFSTETTIDIDALANGEDFTITITRNGFEDICNDIFLRLMEVVKSTLIDSKLRKEDIDKVILTGGSTRMPKIQKMIKYYFDKEPLKNIHPDEAVAIGAAIQGAIANNVIDKGLQRLKLLDVTPLSLGIGLSNGEMDIIIRRNTQIPCERIRKYKTSKDYQSKIILKVYQGERIFTKDNSFLGNLIIRIPPLKKGEVKIDVTFGIDINGLLNIYVKDNEGKKYDLKIGVDNLLNKEEIEKNINEKNKSDLKKLKIKKALKEVCLKYKEIGSDNQKIKADEILNWIKPNKNIEIKRYEDKLKEMKDCH